MCIHVVYTPVYMAKLMIKSKVGIWPTMQENMIKQFSGNVCCYQCGSYTPQHWQIN